MAVEIVKNGGLKYVDDMCKFYVCICNDRVGSQIRG